MTTGITTKVQGTTFSIANVGGTPVLIGNITDGSGLSEPVNRIDITNWNSTAMESRPGRRKTGTYVLEVDLNLDDLGQVQVEAAQALQAIRTCKITLPTGTLKVITFSAYVLNVTFSADDDGVWKSQITFKLTTKPVRSAS